MTEDTTQSKPEEKEKDVPSTSEEKPEKPPPEEMKKKPKSEPPKIKTKEEIAEEKRLSRHGQYKRLVLSLLAFVALGWMLGRLSFGIYWISGLLVMVYIFWKNRIFTILDFVTAEAESDSLKERCFRNAETAEWLNFFINRWCIFSDRSLLNMIKGTLDPLLDFYKPSFISSLEVFDFTLGNRTPFFKNIVVYDSHDDQVKIKANELYLYQTPPDLTNRPKYQAVLDLDFGLCSPGAKFVIRIQLGEKGKMFDAIGTDVAVEDLKLSGRMQMVFHFNENIPFPHLAALSISFLEVPEVSFGVRMLKAFQLMEFPMIKNWVGQIINDTLKLAMVDPGRITIPLCNDPDIVGRGAAYACGVLTLSISGGMDGPITDDPYWCAITVGEQKVQTRELDGDVKWKDHVSLLLYNLQYDRVTIKLKGKRKLGTKYTLTEYNFILSRLDLENEPQQEHIVEKTHIPGSKLKINMEFTPFPLLEINKDTTLEEFNTNYIARLTKDQYPIPMEVAGVLCVRVHSGHNMIPMDKNGFSDPYVTIYENKRKVFTGPEIEKTLDPVWDNIAEFCVADYSQTTLSFVVHDKDASALETIRLKDDPDDFMGSCNLELTKETPIFFKKNLDLFYKIHSAPPGKNLKKAGRICVSTVFRPVETVAKSEKKKGKCGIPVGEPLDSKMKKKDDSQALEAILCAERGSIEVSVDKGRNLVSMDITGKSDPFVTIKIGHKGKEKFKSKVIYNTLNPTWDEKATLALPADNEIMVVDVWDKDPLTQEKMGHLIFTQSKLKELGVESSEKQWYKLKAVKKGEILLGFKFNPPLMSADTMEEAVLMTAPEGTDETTQDPVNGDSASGDSGVGEGDESADNITKSRSASAIDLSAMPDRFTGISGELLEATNIPEMEDFNHMFFRIRLDRQNKSSNRKRSLRMAGDAMMNNALKLNQLCKTPLVPYSTSASLNATFKMKENASVSPSMYLVVELKNKSKDTLSSISMVLSEFFAGEESVTKWLELDSGGKVLLNMSHSGSKDPEEEA